MFRGGGRVERFSRVLELPTDGPLGRQMFFKQRTQGLHQALYMRSDAHGERAQKVYALDYCAASFVTEGEFRAVCCTQDFGAGMLGRTALRCAERATNRKGGQGGTRRSVFQAETYYMHSGAPIGVWVWHVSVVYASLDPRDVLRVHWCVCVDRRGEVLHCQAFLRGR